MTFKGKIYEVGESNKLSIIVLTENIKRIITLNYIEKVKSLRINVRLILVEDKGSEFSFAKSWNAGISQFYKNPTMYVAFSHDDVIFNDNTVEKIIELLEIHRDIDVGVPIIRENGIDNLSILLKIMPDQFYTYSKIGSHIPILLFPLIEPFRNFIIKRFFQSKENELDFGSPINKISEGYIIRLLPFCILRESILSKIGPFDENYYFGEDIDYTYRLYLSDAKCSVISDSSIVHLGSYSIGKRESKPLLEKYAHLKRELTAYNITFKKYAKMKEILYDKAKQNTVIL